MTGHTSPEPPPEETETERLRDSMDTLQTIVNRVREAVGTDQPAPAEARVHELEQTARVLSALHRSAEDTVTRVIDLYESWVHAGPPPLGASMARWWDKRLVELRAALQPDGQQPAPPEPADWPRLLDGFQALLDAYPADLDPDGPAVRSRALPAGLIARWRDTVHAARKQVADQTTEK